MGLKVSYAVEHVITVTDWHWHCGEKITHPRKMEMYNDDDSIYVQEFKSVEEVNSLIAELVEARNEMWPPEKFE